jgi:hypothetical protein
VLIGRAQMTNDAVLSRIVERLPASLSARAARLPPAYLRMFDRGRMLAIGIVGVRDLPEDFASSSSRGTPAPSVDTALASTTSPPHETSVGRENVHAARGLLEAGR